jgi:hypothetical protein
MLIEYVLILGKEVLWSILQAQQLNTVCKVNCQFIIPLSISLFNVIYTQKDIVRGFVYRRKQHHCYGCGTGA